MRLFSSQRDEASLPPEDVINLLWRYEVSEDGGKTWYPESDREDAGCYVLRRGNWVAPSLN
jgi:hypothetical protein